MYHVVHRLALWSWRRGLLEQLCGTVRLLASLTRARFLDTSLFIVCLSASWLTPAGQEAREPARPCCIRVCVCFSTENISLHRCHAIFHVGSMYTCVLVPVPELPWYVASLQKCHGAHDCVGLRRYRPEGSRERDKYENKNCKLLAKARGRCPKTRTLSRCFLNRQERIVRLPRRSRLLTRSFARH